jgi:hypothetical protein
MTLFPNAVTLADRFAFIDMKTENKYRTGSKGCFQGFFQMR